MITIRQEQDVAVQENNHIFIRHFHHQELSPRIILIMVRQEQDVAVQDNVRAVRGETAACPDRIILIILTEKAE